MWDAACGGSLKEEKKSLSRKKQMYYIKLEKSPVLIKGANGFVFFRGKIRGNSMAYVSRAASPRKEKRVYSLGRDLLEHKPNQTGIMTSNYYAINVSNADCNITSYELKNYQYGNVRQKLPALIPMNISSPVSNADCDVTEFRLKPISLSPRSSLTPLVRTESTGSLELPSLEESSPKEGKKLKKKGNTKENKKYQCKTCEKCFTTSGHLARHSRIHTGERKHICPFPGCQSRFARQDNCMQHYRTHLNIHKKKRKTKVARKIDGFVDTLF